MDDEEAGLAARAARLAGAPLREFVRVRGGGNNRLFRVVAGTRPYALKSYPASPGDGRDRLATEYGALRFLERAGVGPVARAVGADPDGRCVLYEWIDGSPPPADCRRTWQPSWANSPAPRP